MQPTVFHFVPTTVELVLIALAAFGALRLLRIVAQGVMLRLGAPALPTSDAMRFEAKRFERDRIAERAMVGILAAPMLPNERAEDRHPENVAEKAILFANELVLLMDERPVRSIADIDRELTEIRRHVLKACGGQVLPASKLDRLMAMPPDERDAECARLAAEWAEEKKRIKADLDAEKKRAAAPPS